MTMQMTAQTSYFIVTTEQDCYPRAESVSDFIRGARGECQDFTAIVSVTEHVLSTLGELVEIVEWNPVFWVENHS